jgi:hypothetical protein
VRILFEWLGGIGLIAALHVLTNLFQFEFLSLFNNTPQMAVFYIPAAIRVFSAMIFGYWAGLGIALGVLLHSLVAPIVPLTTDEIAINMVQQGAGVSLSLLIWTCISDKASCLSNPEIDFERINAFDILQMCFIQAIINSVTAHIYYIWSPSIHLQFDWYYYIVMLVGDLTGAFLIFIFANILFSLLKRTPFFPRKRHDDIINDK